MDNNRIKFLIEQHQNNNLSNDELQEFYQILEDIDDYSLQSIFDSINDDNFPSFNKDESFRKLSEEIDKLDVIDHHKHNIIKPLYYKLVASACLVFLFSYFIFNYQEFTFLSSSDTELFPSKDEVLAEANIRFADGRTMQLEDMALDTVLYQGLSLVKTNENEISILGNLGSGSSTNLSHSFHANIGSILTLILPDKSIVTLNSGSSITLSSDYGVLNRLLSLDGEGFFDVTHNKDLPFVVQVKDAKINVLGTVFNISGYAEDISVKTTLISGSVRVSRNTDQVTIKPYQQAVVLPNQNISVSNNVSIDHILAWKNGFFRFQDESIANVLRELSKWYPISAIDISEGSQDKFTGSIKRTKKLEDVLNAISEVSSLKFHVQEGRVKVMK